MKTVEIYVEDDDIKVRPENVLLDRGEPVKFVGPEGFQLRLHHEAISGWRAMKWQRSTAGTLQGSARTATSATPARVTKYDVQVGRKTLDPRIIVKPPGQALFDRLLHSPWSLALAFGAGLFIGLMIGMPTG